MPAGSRASMIASRAARMVKEFRVRASGEALRRAAPSIARASTSALARFAPRIVDRRGDGDDAERQQAEAEDEEHLQAGGKPRPARQRASSACRRSRRRVRHRGKAVSRASPANRAFPEGCPRGASGRRPISARRRRVLWRAPARHASEASVRSAPSCRWSMNRHPSRPAAPAAISSCLASQPSAAVPAEQTQIFGGTE